MGNLGVSELVVILLLLMLVFGASRLPALGESLGKTIRNFKRGIAQNEDIEISPVDKKQIPERSASHDGNVSDAEIIEEKKREPRA